MAENKGGSKMEKNNSEANQSVSVINREESRASPAYSAPHWTESPQYWVTVKVQAAQSLEADNPPLTRHSLKGLRKHVRDLLSSKSELLSQAPLKGISSPGRASLTLARGCSSPGVSHAPALSAHLLTPPPSPGSSYPFHWSL